MEIIPLGAPRKAIMKYAIVSTILPATLHLGKAFKPHVFGVAFTRRRRDPSHSSTSFISSKWAKAEFGIAVPVAGRLLGRLVWHDVELLAGRIGHHQGLAGALEEIEFVEGLGDAARRRPVRRDCPSSWSCGCRARAPGVRLRHRWWPCLRSPDHRRRDCRSAPCSGRSA